MTVLRLGCKACDGPVVLRMAVGLGRMCHADVGVDPSCPL